MTNSFFSLGLMSGTSMDGIDASIIQSNGTNEFKPIYDEFIPYEKELLKNLSNLREKIDKPEDLKIYINDLVSLEKKITLAHAEHANKILKNIKKEVSLIGFHGQTIFHDGDRKISKQLGDGNLLSQLTQKTVVYDFRQNDLKNGGQGAPLTPIFHSLLAGNLKTDSILFLNLGGIANETTVYKNKNFYARDIGPGNCLIDQWIKLKSKKNYDKNGNIAKAGKVNKIILDQALDIFMNSSLYEKKSYDTKDFDLSFVRGLSLEDGAATLTEFTAEILSKKISGNLIYACGGGRKNYYLIERIEKKINNTIHQIEELNINGDFVESQAFAYLAIRSKLNLPISFPETTGCTKPVSGGLIVNNF